MKGEGQRASYKWLLSASDHRRSSNSGSSKFVFDNGVLNEVESNEVNEAKCTMERAEARMHVMLELVLFWTGA